MAEDNKRNEAEFALRKSLKKEIDELWDCKHNINKFLILLSNNYVSYKNEKVTFKEEDLKSSKIRKTLMKAMIHYHPDKKSFADSTFTEKDFYLRDEITKIINSITSELKGEESK